MEILELQAECMDYLWGGTRLREEFGKVSDKEKIAESWELSSRSEGKSIIKNGKYKGKSFAEFLNIEKSLGNDPIGTLNDSNKDFPVLIKLIDAKQNLSVQVHPSDEYALKNEGEWGKTEVWYIVDCLPDSRLIYGFKEKITKDEFKNCIENNTLTEKVNYVTVKKGDVFFIPSGTLHAIGEGILIAEIQQNSNITYRVFDYNRKDKNGKTRQLHVEKALDVTNLDLPPVQENQEAFELGESDVKTICKCNYFSAYRVKNHGVTNLNADEKSFVHLLVIDGSAELVADNSNKFIMKKGGSFYIPASFGDFAINGECEFILTRLEK